MVFHTSKRNVIYPNSKVNNSNIERVTQFNFLGVILHSHMSWNKHINHFSMKITRSIVILCRLRNVYPDYCGDLLSKKHNSSSTSAPKESSQNNYQ